MNRKNGMIVAIDGPAGVGKSSVGKALAASLGYGFINTGEMYRALAWKMEQAGVSTADMAAADALARSSNWEFRKTDGVTIKTVLDGRLLDKELLGESVSRNSSAIAANPPLREFMTALQRRLGADGGIVMEGRDIGTVVFPEADLKIYLDATAQERARRRYEQLKATGLAADYDAILSGIISRDSNDSARKVAPLKKAPDSQVIDTSTLSIEQVIAMVQGLAKNKCSRI